MRATDRDMPVDLSGRPLALVKGAGDLATGVALRLRAAGFAVVMTEIERPTVVRRSAAFAEAVYEGRTIVEDVEAVLAGSPDGIGALLGRGVIPVVVDPSAALRREIRPLVLVDAIVAKVNLGTRIDDAPAVIALGPGFVVGRDVHAVVETMRGHDLGRVIYEGAALSNTGVPGEVGGFADERILRSPGEGVFRATREIGDHVGRDEVVGHVGDQPVPARVGGVLRGLLRSGLDVRPGFKLGDVDPRAQPELCFAVSDKARAVAGGVLEAACALLGGVGAIGRDVSPAPRGRRQQAQEA